MPEGLSWLRRGRIVVVQDVLTPDLVPELGGQAGYIIIGRRGYPSTLIPEDCLRPLELRYRAPGAGRPLTHKMVG